MFLFLIPILCGFSASGSFPKPLSKAEEQRLLLQWKNGTPAEQEEAKQSLILHNLRLVAHISKKYHSQRQEPEELLSIGIVGLIKAVLSYDIEKSIRLATYASRCIENAILTPMLPMLQIMCKTHHNGMYWVKLTRICIYCRAVHPHLLDMHRCIYTSSN